MAEQKLITVKEIADALGIPGQADAVHQGLKADGLTILEDWAGRPAITFEDAKATIDRHRKQQADWEEKTRRDLIANQDAHLCQKEFDEICGYLLPILRNQEPFDPGAEADSRRRSRVRGEAYEAIKDKYSPEALARLVIKPITTHEPLSTPMFRPINIIQSTDDVLAAASPSVRARLKAFLGIGNLEES